MFKAVRQIFCAFDKLNHVVEECSLIKHFTGEKKISQLLYTKSGTVFPLIKAKSSVCKL